METLLFTVEKGFIDVENWPTNQTINFLNPQFLFGWFDILFAHNK